MYNEILEHVPRQEGEAYLRLITCDAQIFSAINLFKANYAYGGPVMCEYEEAGEFSPTTLRYVKVLTDLKRQLGTLDNLQIYEIGVG